MMDEIDDDIDDVGSVLEVRNAELAQEMAVVQADGRDSDSYEQASGGREENEIDNMIEMQMESEAAEDEEPEHDDNVEDDTFNDSGALDPESYLATQMDDLEAAFRVALSDSSLTFPGGRPLSRVEVLFSAIKSLPVHIKQEMYLAVTRLERGEPDEIPV